MRPASDDTTVEQSLAAAVRELEWIGALGRRLQDRLSPWLAASEGRFEAQGLDELVQHAEGLRLFLEAVRADCAEARPISSHRAAEKLGLSAQRSRLTGAAPFAHAPPDDGGELELL